MVPLQALNPIYVDFGVPQQAARAGPVVGRRACAYQPRRICAGVAFTGRVTALDSVVDRDDQERPGAGDRSPNPEGAAAARAMFVQVDAVLGASRPVIALPASAISYAPYGDSVFRRSRTSRTRKGKPTAACGSSSSSLKGRVATK